MNKSSFMFLLKPGEVYQFEIEPFFYNTTTKLLEPVSSSTKSTPRLKKVLFGPVQTITAVDEEVIEITNKKYEKIKLLRSKLSPMIDNEDSLLKNTILTFMNKSTSALVGALNALLERFHVDSCKIPETLDVVGFGSPQLNSSTQSKADSSLLEESPGSCTSVSLLSKNSGKRCSLRFSSVGSLYSDHRKRARTDDSGDETEVEDDETMSSADQSKTSKDLNVDEGSDRDEDPDIDESDVTANKEDILIRIGQVISDAKYSGVKSDKCEVPSSLLIDRDIVANLKESLLKHPDKTQCIIGVVRVLDEEKDKVVGKMQVFVNPELFVAIQELGFEGINFYGEDQIPAVVHTLKRGEEVSAETLGIFLHKNAKEFSDQMRESMTYQDLLRFCCLTVSNQGQGEEVKDFIKKSLKDFGKGKENSALFLYFAM